MNINKRALIVAFAAIGLFAAGVIAGYFWGKFTAPLKVKEPLEITAYPEILELYAGENLTFTVNITNYATVKYIVTLSFKLNDTEYQEAYVTFSDFTYIVEPGINTLTAWVYVSGDAPPAELELTVEFARTTYIE